MPINAGKPISEDVMNMYLEVFCSKMLQIFYLNSHFFSLWRSDGWQRVRNWFYQVKGKGQKSVRKPSMDKPCIIIPMHMHNNHWVIIVQRIMRDKTIVFFYADDLNCAQMQEEIHTFFRSNDMNVVLCPKQVKWVKCPATTYLPHTNESLL